MPKPTCVIFNPAAGRGRAARLLGKLPDLPADTALRPTTGPGTAIELARAACDEGFARVVAAGGDGTVHEVANGILRSGPPRRGLLDVAARVDERLRLHPRPRSLVAGRPGRRHSSRTLAADVGVIEADGRRRFFVNGCGIGFNGMVDDRGRAGSAGSAACRCTRLAVLKALVKHFAAPPMTITLDGTTTERPTLALSVNLGQREGGFALTPHARLDDGLFDYLHVGDIRRWELIRHFPGMVSGNIPVDHPKVAAGRAARPRFAPTRRSASTPTARCSAPPGTVSGGSCTLVDPEPTYRSSVTRPPSTAAVRPETEAGGETN